VNANALMPPVVNRPSIVELLVASR
jgi:hypothetical protein